ncbi:hypothetical protein [Streptacidiphilus carbonis]|uniref:hypothetical protein n=1 Tax=Streptacidiphilus carbonis TaxID=105422 RepID=UPI0005A98505|nr:hypothetical protein [Streptacidiphilus carbonis]
MTTMDAAEAEALAREAAYQMHCVAPEDVQGYGRITQLLIDAGVSRVDPNDVRPPRGPWADDLLHALGQLLADLQDGPTGDRYDLTTMNSHLIALEDLIRQSIPADYGTARMVDLARRTVVQLRHLSPGDYEAYRRIAHRLRDGGIDGGTGTATAVGPLRDRLEIALAHLINMLTVGPQGPWVLTSDPETVVWTDEQSIASHLRIINDLLASES